MGLDYIISSHLMQNHGKAGRSVLSNRYSVAVQKADLTKKSSYGAFRLPTVSPPMPPPPYIYLDVNALTSLSPTPAPGRE